MDRDLGEKYWYVWLIIALVVTGSLFLVYWFVLRSTSDLSSGTPSSDGKTLPKPDFSLFNQLQIPNAELWDVSFSPDNSTGFITTRDTTDGTTNGNFFSLDLKSGSFQSMDAIKNVRESVILDDLAVIFRTDGTNVCNTYTYDTSWKKGNGTFQAIPRRLWSKNSKVYCVGYWNKSVTVFEFKNANTWDSVYTSTEVQNDIMTVDITDDGSIYFVDKVFQMYLIKMNEDGNGWIDGTPTSVSQVWDNLTSPPTNLADMSIKGDGSLIAFSLARTILGGAGHESFNGTYNIAEGKYSFKSTKKAALIASTSALSDFRMLSFIESGNLCVYRTNVDSNFDVINPGNSGFEQKGDPAEFNNLNSITAKLIYFDNKQKILLIAGGASENSELSFYTMNV